MTTDLRDRMNRADHDKHLLEIHQGQPPTERHSQPTRKTKKISLTLSLRGVVATFMLLAIASGIIGWQQFKVNHGPFPPKVVKGLKYQLYYPSSLPAGYHVDPSSYDRHDNVLIFSIKSASGKSIAVTEEAVPSDAPVRSNNGSPVPIPGEKAFSSAIGQVHIGLWGANYVADIITPQTWIILNVSGFTVEQAQALTQSFKPI